MRTVGAAARGTVDDVTMSRPSALDEPPNVQRPEGTAPALTWNAVFRVLDSHGVPPAARRLLAEAVTELVQLRTEVARLRARLADAEAREDR